MVLPDGRVLGTLCVFSAEPGELSRAKLDALTDLAGQAVALFEQAELTREADEQAARFRQARDEAERRGALTAAVLDTIGIVACDADGRLTLANRAARELHGIPEDPTVDLTDWPGGTPASPRTGRPCCPASAPRCTAPWSRGRSGTRCWSSSPRTGRRSPSAATVRPWSTPLGGSWVPSSHRRTSPGRRPGPGADRGPRPGAGRHPGQDRVPRRPSHEIRTPLHGVLDLQMPRMSGLEATTIRALPGAAGRTRLLALTAETLGSPRQRASPRAWTASW
jgi:hypothetical protein